MKNDDWLSESVSKDQWRDVHRATPMRVAFFLKGQTNPGGEVVAFKDSKSPGNTVK